MRSNISHEQKLGGIFTINKKKLYGTWSFSHVYCHEVSKERYFISINCWCKEFLNSRLGRKGEEDCLTVGVIRHFRSRIKEMNHKIKLIEVI